MSLFILRSKNKWEDLTLSHDSIDRVFKVYTPAIYNNSVPAPCVFLFHGGAGTAQQIADNTQFHTKADTVGCIVVYPQSVSSTGGYRWNDGRDDEHTSDDVGFVEALVAHIQTIRNIDSGKIYASGISNGAMLTYRLAAETTGLFSAYAPVSGNMTQFLIDNYTSGATAVNLQHYGSTNDPNMPWLGGDVTAGPFVLTQVISAEASVQFWTDLIGGGGEETSLLSTTETFHGWQVNANNLVWSFFDAH